MEVDKHNLRQIILDSVRQLDAELDFFNQLNLTRRSFDKVIICGMGGSALAGDFFSYFKNESFLPLSLNIPVLIHRSYDLPLAANENSLIICSSYSGDTEEPISSFNKAKQQNFEIAGIAGGGRLTELFQENKTPWVKIPRNDIPPRASLGYQFKGLTKIFMAYGLLTSSAQNEISTLSKKIEPAQLENDAKIKCPRLANKIPIIYTSQDNELIGRIWKIKFNENTKIPAFYNVLPELNHNEMVGWTKNLGPFYFIFVRDSDDLPRVQKRMNLTAELLIKSGYGVDFINPAGDNVLEKLFWALIYGDWLSYHLALFYGIDPTPIEMVEEFKKRLAA